MKKALVALGLVLFGSVAYAQTQWDRSYLCDENGAEPYVMKLSYNATRMTYSYLGNSENVFTLTLREAVGTKWIYSGYHGRIESIATFYADGSIAFRKRIGNGQTYTDYCR